MEISKRLLVPYSAERMFDLIEAAEHYPAFMPWCAGATIVERSDDVVVADIVVAHKGVRFDFRTRNPKRRPQAMSIRLERGPFRRFEGEWRLWPLGGDGCRIEFEMRYDFNSVMARLAGPVFDRITSAMVDAYVARADALYGGQRDATAPVAADRPLRRCNGERHRVRHSRRRPCPDEHDRRGRRRGRPDPGPHPCRRIRRPTDQSRPATEREAMNDQNRIAALKSTKLAQELTDDEAAVLAAVVTLRDLKPGEVLVKEGPSDNHLYVILQGDLAVIKNAGTDAAETLFTLGGGDFVGELSFIDGTARYASLVAADDARVLGLEREKLESLLASHPQVVYRVMRAILRTVHQIQRRLSIQSVELTNYIYKQHGRY